MCVCVCVCERERERERAVYEYSCDTILVTIYHLVFVFVLSEVSLSRLELDRLSLANEIACKKVNKQIIQYK